MSYSLAICYGVDCLLQSWRSPLPSIVSLVRYSTRLPIASRREAPAAHSVRYWRMRLSIPQGSSSFPSASLRSASPRDPGLHGETYPLAPASLRSLCPYSSSVANFTLPSCPNLVEHLPSLTPTACPGLSRRLLRGLRLQLHSVRLSSGAGDSSSLRLLKLLFNTYGRSVRRAYLLPIA